MQIMNNIKSQRIFEKIMPLCLALFFARTVFIGYKYLFFATFVPCFLYSVYVLFKQGVAIPRLKMLLLPVFVVLLFFAHFSPLSNVVKESVNIAIIVYFVAFSNLYYADDKCDSFLKWIVRLTLFAGIIAISRSVLSMMGFTLQHLSVFFEGERFSLVRDNNFYSLFFIVAIILTARLFLQHKVSSFFVFVCVLISIINIGASVSRRACALYVLLIVALMIIVKKRRCEGVFLYNISILLAFVFCIIGLFVFSGGYSPNMSYEKKTKLYRLYTFIGKSESFQEFDLRQRRKYYVRLSQDVDKSNLFYKGDLKNGLIAWEAQPASSSDNVKFNLVKGEDGEPIIRIERNIWGGSWQIHYKGRPIVYHKDVTYVISFAYRVVKGIRNPFNVGWWVNEGHGYLVDLPQTIESIDSVWNRCSVSYKFKADYINLDCFLNSLHGGAEIEVKDISLTCDDTTGLPMYADQLSDSVIHSFFVKEGADTINYFTAPRTARWRYALELWQTRYTTQQKIFGQGFKYLEWYGEKFYNNPKRYDFPHNPIISSFLYSGIIGGIVYIIFLISSLWLYWKKRKTMGIFFIMYLCCMFFCMFSGSSHFSFPLFAFLSFLPFVEYGKQKNEVPEPAQ